MLGSSYVLTTTDIENLHPWTHAELEQVLDDAFRSGDTSAISTVNMFVDSSLKKPIRKILKFLGENSDVSGGTMDEPNTISEHAEILHHIFTDFLVEGFGHHFDPSQPMWSESVWRTRCFVDFLWKHVEYPTGDSDDECLASLHNGPGPAGFQ